MNEFHFGLGEGWLPKKAAEIARRHGAKLINYEEPCGRRRHWFAAENLGEPFNRATAEAVLSDLEKAGLL